jgi:hypothetical protein
MRKTMIVVADAGRHADLQLTLESLGYHATVFDLTPALERQVVAATAAFDAESGEGEPFDVFQAMHEGVAPVRRP